MYSHIVPEQIMIGVNPYYQIKRLLLEHNNFKKIVFVYDKKEIVSNKKIFNFLKHLEKKLKQQKREVKTIIQNEEIAKINPQNCDVILLIAINNINISWQINTNKNIGSIPQIRINYFYKKTNMMNCFFLLNQLYLDENKVINNNQNQIFTTVIYPFIINKTPLWYCNYFKSLDIATKKMICFQILYSVTKLSKNIQNSLIEANYIGCINAYLKFFVLEQQKHSLLNFYEAQKCFFLAFNNDLDYPIYKNIKNPIDFTNKFITSFNYDRTKNIDEISLNNCFKQYLININDVKWLCNWILQQVENLSEVR